MSIQTEFEFELPKGYIDKDGNVHRNGVMRLATAADEIIPLKDTRVQINPGFLSTKILARVIIKLGT
ncbi:MAG: phage tail assembly protein, partial [Clostridia bacterium]|nr:phage tail assembly protein [Clostridia bacterium]